MNNEIKEETMMTDAGVDGMEEAPPVHGEETVQDFFDHEPSKLEKAEVSVYLCVCMYEQNKR